MRFEVFMALKMWIAVFWVVLPWLPAFWRNVLPPSSILKMEIICSSETLATTYNQW
jgi:hypothetical protein